MCPGGGQGTCGHCPGAARKRKYHTVSDMGWGVLSSSDNPQPLPPGRETNRQKEKEGIIIPPHQRWGRNRGLTLTSILFLPPHLPSSPRHCGEGNPAPHSPAHCIPILHPGLLHAGVACAREALHRQLSQAPGHHGHCTEAASGAQAGAAGRWPAQPLLRAPALEAVLRAYEGHLHVAGDQLLTTSPLFLGSKVICPWKPLSAWDKTLSQKLKELPEVKISKGNDVEKAHVVSDRRESNFQKCAREDLIR